MEQHKLLIPKKPLWIIILAGFFIAGLGAFFKIQHINLEFVKVFFVIGISLSALAQIIVWIDVIRNSFDTKMNWVVGLFMTNILGSIAYLYCRNELFSEPLIDKEIDPKKERQLKNIKMMMIVLIVILLLCQPIGAFLKINHLPGSIIFSMISIITLSLLFGLGVTNYLIKKK